MAKIKEVSQIERFREAVQEKELVARNNKAEYEKMYYHLAAVDLQEKYLAQLEAEQKERVKQDEEVLAQMKT